MLVRGKILTALLLAWLLLSGCSAATATLDLISVVRKGIQLEQESEAQQHAQILQHLTGQLAALDSAFDADVRLVAAGQIKSSDGSIVELSPEWIVSARRGYIAARDLLGDQVRSAEGAHSTRQDNLKSIDESLEMASRLVVREWNVTERIRQHVLDTQRRLLHER